MAEVILPKEISDLLEEAFSEKIRNFDVNVHEGNKKGEGFLSDILFLTLKNRKTTEEYHLAIKQVLAGKQNETVDFMSASFENEIVLYTKALPALQNFQKTFKNVPAFDNFPKCYGVMPQRGKEKLVLENLKLNGYEIHPKRIPLTSKMFEKIFQLYGKFHALSFAHQKHRPEEFSKLISSLKKNWPIFTSSALMSRILKDASERVKLVLENHKDDKLLEKFRIYVDSSEDIIKNSIQYKGSYGVITHGDSWSNNMMFKYSEDREIADIKLFDFQLSDLGTPVYDLSYSFYSGASKESLDNLEKFLKIYHNSLNENLKLYGLTAEKLYPFEVLKDEWKKYCPFGFIMGYLIWGAKYIDENHVPDFNKVMDDENKFKTYKVVVDMEKLDAPVYNLVRHMYENDFM